ncbi:serine protease persephone-like [Sitodiplosis mosellana]|uniref:serine protease persephone-like n=1 Tax=Sitodiplosis mosellana TaxID=263140 RepID=UPI0024452594|nr:serine protease persephone-like [Sitodiplosis mosellana]
MIKTLLSYGVNLHVRNNEKVTPLFAAVQAGHEAASRELIANGDDVNAANLFGWTPLHKAAQTGRLEIIKLLIKSGADKHVKLPNGLTAAEIAAQHGHNDIAELLNRDSTQTQVSKIASEFKSSLRPSQQACEVYMKMTANTILSVASVPANEGEFPWMAALGFLHHEKAAHCVPRIRPPTVVRLGKVSLLDDDDKEPDNYDIREIIRHPEYSEDTKKHDIALIRVTRRIYFTSFVSPACLQTDVRDENADVKLIVTGWGYTDANQTSPSNVLRKAELTSMPWDECNAKLLEFNREASEEALRDGLNRGQYCAYDPQGISDSCYGDSGGPVQHFKNSRISTVLGVISFGFGCGKGLPSINTRVAYYLDWIESIIWPNGFTLPKFI